MVLKIFLQKSDGEADIKNRLMDMGRREERVRCMESNTEAYSTTCKIDRQQEVTFSGNSNRVSVSI